MTRNQCSKLLVVLLAGWFIPLARGWIHMPYHKALHLKSRLQLNDSSSSSNDQDPVLRLPLMEAELATFPDDNSNDSDTSNSDKEKLKTAIGDAKTAAEFGVRKAQMQFYDAFSQGDYQAMDRIWSTLSHVRCVHPGMSSLEGREAVMASWQQIFAVSSATGSSNSPKFEIEPARSQIEICGLTAFCSCIEKTQGGGELEALNIYKREDGSWKMTLHMAGPVVMLQQGKDEAFF